MGHITIHHPGLDASDLDKRFIIDIQIQEQEERWMRVLSDLTDKYRSEHNYLFLSEEDLAIAERELEQERKHTKKRSHDTVGDSKNKKQRR